MVVTLAIICVDATPLVFTSLAFVNACWNVKNALYLSIVSLRSQDPTDKVRHSPAVNKCQHSAFNINKCKSYNNWNTVTPSSKNHAWCDSGYQVYVVAGGR